MKNDGPTNPPSGPQPGYPDRRDRPGDMWRRIGMIAPSSNTVAEPETARMAAPLSDLLSIHFARLGVTHISTSDKSSDQFGFDGLVSAARLLADARPDCILWNGTAASWLGLSRDDELARRLAVATGVASATTMQFYRAAFEALGTRRLALVTPYTRQVQDLVVGNLESLGLEVVTERCLEDAGNFSYAEYSEELVAEELRLAIRKGAGVDTAAVMCTNYRGARAAALVEAEFGLPVLDSVALTLWGGLALTGVPAKALTPFGRVFSDLPAKAAREVAAWPSGHS